MGDKEKAEGQQTGDVSSVGVRRAARGSAHAERQKFLPNGIRPWTVAPETKYTNFEI